MKNKSLKMFALVILCWANAVQVSAQSVVKIAAAANLRYLLSEVEQIYEAKFQDVDLQINYGASGRFYQQIVSGAPYDLLLSADDTLPKKLKEEGITTSDSHIYTYGKLALYSLQSNVAELGLEALKGNNLKRVAIANPRTAPYGARSMELLKSLGMWESLESRVVYGESIAQAAQFAMTGNCELGFVALSLLMNPETELKGNYYIIPEELYSPIAQAGIVLKEGVADHFFEYILSDECAAIWAKYGYSAAK